MTARRFTKYVPHKLASDAATGRLAAGQIVDVRVKRSGRVELCRVIRPYAVATEFHGASYHFAVMRRYDWIARRWLKASLVQIGNVVRIYRDSPLDFPKRKAA